MGELGEIGNTYRERWSLLGICTWKTQEKTWINIQIEVLQNKFCYTEATNE